MSVYMVYMCARVCAVLVCVCVCAAFVCTHVCVCMYMPACVQCTPHTYKQMPTIQAGRIVPTPSWYGILQTAM